MALTYNFDTFLRESTFLFVLPQFRPTTCGTCLPTPSGLSLRSTSLATPLLRSVWGLIMALAVRGVSVSVLLPPELLEATFL